MRPDLPCGSTPTHAVGIDGGESDMPEIHAFEIQIPVELFGHWGWFFAYGVGVLLLGILAVARSMTATVLTLLFVGWLLVVAGGIEIAQALTVGRWVGFFYHLAAAVLFGVTGIMLLARPEISTEIATVLVAMLFLVTGLFQFVGAIALQFPGWGWQAADALLTFALGVLVLAQWPASGLWAIGLLVGLDLIFYGAVWIILALQLRAA
jgi:uncharacterized membrane protein HdeD (DUF308 family)